MGGAANIWVLCLESKLEGFRSTHEGELIRPDSVLVPDAPLWITEYGYLLYTGPTATPGTPTASQVVDTLMNPLVDWLQTG